MKLIRTHDYRIDVRECKFYQSRYRQREFDLQGFLETRRSRKGNRIAWRGWSRRKDPIMRFTPFSTRRADQPAFSSPRGGR
jgi:hypothetical protein